MFTVVKLAEAYLLDSFGQQFHSAVAMLQATDWLKYAPGVYTRANFKVFVIDDPAFQSPDNIRWESHDLHADLTWVYVGRHSLGVLPKAYQEVRSYDSDEDVTLFQGHNGSFLELPELSLAVVTPRELHMPGIGATIGSRRVVVKVPMNLTDY